LKINLTEIKEHRRLKPKKWYFFWYYAPTWFFLFLPILNIYFLIRDSINNDTVKLERTINGLGIVWVFLVLAILTFIIKYFALRFKSIKADLTNEEYNSVIDKTIEQLNWEPIKRSQTHLVADSHSSLIGTGERVTIVKNNNEILINSICNPDSRAAIFSFGGNEKNIWTFKRNVKASCQQRTEVKNK